MIQNSNLRRIDELGRIVIPKDIRKKLHIKDNEPLEIYIQNDEIHMKKYSAIEDITEYIKYMADIFSRITQNNYIITNRETIIATTNFDFQNIISNESVEKLIHAEKNLKNDYKEIKLNNDTYIKGIFNSIPIIIDNDRFGIIIEYNSNNKQMPLEIIKIFKYILEEKLNNY